MNPTTEVKHTPFDRLAADLALERSRESTAAIAAQLRSAWQECEALKSSNASLLAACQLVEWLSEPEGNGLAWRCPVCHGDRKVGHKADCILRVAIASARKEQV